MLQNVVFCIVAMYRLRCMSRHLVSFIIFTVVNYYMTTSSSILSFPKMVSALK